MGIKKQTPEKRMGLYIHWPYCIHKCPYCDFASTVCQNVDETALYEGYCRDIKLFTTSQTLTSIFFGGGTPSLMSIKLCEKLLNQIHKNFHLSSQIEISLEANPDTVDKNKLKAFHQLGINRLSIGVQALNDTDLHFLGRTHSCQTAINCIQTAQQLFKNINIDLIYARPRQSLKNWEQELLFALSFELPHYSLYQLTIEENTLFCQKGQQAASSFQAARLYQLTDEIMSKAKCPAYEVSNYSKKGFQCQHNLTYWLGNDYIGIGPAAHGRLGLMATQNPPSVKQWLQNGSSQEKLTTDQRNLEKLLMGLRLRDRSYPIHNLNPIGVEKALQRKWLIKTKEGVLPTQKGTLMLNQLILLLAP